MNGVELGELRCFVHVAETLSFTEGARRAHLSKPTISKSIKRLENKLEASLFERTSRHVSLTMAGEVLLGHAREVLGAVEELGTALDATDGRLRGELRIGTMELFAAYALPAALGHLAGRHPAMRTRTYLMGPDRMVRLLQEGRLDVGLCVSTGDVDGLPSEVLIESPSAVVCGPKHPLAQHDHVPNALLAEHRFVVPEFFEAETRRAIDGFPHGHDRQVGATVELLQMAIEMVANGPFLGHFPLVAVRCQLNHGELLPLKCDVKGVPLQLRAVYRKASPGTRALVATMRETLQEALQLDCAL